MQAKVVEATATSSDHWPLSLGLLPKRRTRGEQPKGAILPSKPIGWQLTELTFSDKVRERTGMEMPVAVAEIMQHAYHVDTDGSFTGYRNSTARLRNTDGARRSGLTLRAGGAAFFEEGPPPSEAHDAVPGIGIILADANFDGAMKGRVTTLQEAAIVRRATSGRCGKRTTPRRYRLSWRSCLSSWCPFSETHIQNAGTPSEPTHPPPSVGGFHVLGPLL